MHFLFQISFSPQSFSLMYFDFWDSKACVSLQCTIFFTHKHSSEENQYRTGELNSWYERLNTFFPHEGAVCWVLHLSQYSTYRMYVYWVCQVYSTEKYVQHHRKLWRKFWASWISAAVLQCLWAETEAFYIIDNTETTAQQNGRITVMNMKENIDLSLVKVERF